MRKTFLLWISTARADRKRRHQVGQGVTFNAHILETGTNSYRLRTTKNRGRQTTATGGAKTSEHSGANSG